MIEGARAPGDLGDGLGSVDHDVADRQLLEQRQPVGTREAERAADLDVLRAVPGERRAHDLNLTLEAVDEAGSVAPADEQDRVTI